MHDHAADRTADRLRLAFRIEVTPDYGDVGKDQTLVGVGHYRGKGGSLAKVDVSK